MRGNPYEEAMKRALLILGAIVAGFVAVVWGTRFAYRRIRSRSDKFKRPFNGMTVRNCIPFPVSPLVMLR